MKYYLLLFVVALLSSACAGTKVAKTETSIKEEVVEVEEVATSQPSSAYIEEPDIAAANKSGQELGHAIVKSLRTQKFATLEPVLVQKEELKMLDKEFGKNSSDEQIDEIIKDDRLQFKTDFQEIIDGVKKRDIDIGKIKLLSTKAEPIKGPIYKLDMQLQVGEKSYPMVVECIYLNNRLIPGSGLSLKLSDF